MLSDFTREAAVNQVGSVFLIQTFTREAAVNQVGSVFLIQTFMVKIPYRTHLVIKQHHPMQGIY